MIIFDGRTHLAIGFIVSLGLIWLNRNIGVIRFNILELILFISMIEFGSILPDIDTPNSIIGKKVDILSIFINKACGHRGLFHNFYFYSIIYVILLILCLLLAGSRYWLIGFIGCYIGVISHIVGDRVSSKIKKELKKDLKRGMNNRV